MSKDPWLKITLVNEGINGDILSAWLNIYEVDSLQFLEDRIDIYIQTHQKEDVIDVLTNKIGIASDKIHTEAFKNQNWNAVWESNFQAVQIDSLYLRAKFHQPAPKDCEEIIILPKMAFGTGHHDTTYLMMAQINKMDLANKDILDYGCGTGILSILPLKRECKSLLAIDIQPEAVENTIEHFEANQCPSELYKVEMGDLDLVEGIDFNIILANINRHVLIQNASRLFDLTRKDGIVLCSGILKEDRTLMVETFSTAGFEISDIQSKGEWLLIILKKT
ncbi:MAG: 50S ribosomal protein L11 methyltransferase [Saprospiraceae bacterium]|nr:50S ribosomal protein L11 methyltransferase [Saprospiraceae bacterium]